MNAPTLENLATGQLKWSDGIADGLIQASGTRSDLSEIFLALIKNGNEER
jgi:hypothetical protein